MGAPVYCMFCTHCKYPAPAGLPEACRHPNGPRDPVNGRLPKCISMRQRGAMCGPDGSLYEKRPAPVIPPKKLGLFARVAKFITGGLK
jgi:hypothetical protein